MIFFSHFRVSQFLLEKFQSHENYKAINSSFNLYHRILDIGEKKLIF